MTETDLLNKLGKEVVTFLGESNAIEGVYDKDSLIDACKAWDYVMGFEYLTIPVIKTTHRILMERQSLPKKYIGEFRDVAVMVGGEEKYPHQAIPHAIMQWLDQIYLQTIVTDTLAARQYWSRHLHVFYEEIHPFVDGNGRTGRIFMNWLRVKVFEIPLLVILEKDKHEYYQWFNKNVRSPLL